ncbi:aldo/keto reductase [Aestuariibacter halophilus]|uniref:Aldo/keto reductase n=1 Tax=Fluctibacter halophilus TaxID=226011 RepID=A0ABS8G2G7_9ALTE|nr:aldo/keto reductase [Aestuariibacter halophilus]MCC2614777.1 aldo/keto reductase [Aestuariibacter halophilus]
MLTRRQFIKTSALATLGAMLPVASFARPRIDVPYPIGMGTWITFNVGRHPALLEARQAVLAAFLDAGGQLIDSSPMYGSSEAVLGHCLKQLDARDQVYCATKTWTSSAEDALHQRDMSLHLWGRPRIDLLQVHNLQGWQQHLPRYRAWQAEGLVGSIGVTTSHARRHDDLDQILRSQSMDYLQLSYNLANESAHNILALAQDKGIKVIANRPFAGGHLFDTVRNQPLPDEARNLGCQCWSHVFLRYVLSHPAISHAIPATRQVPHMIENMSALNTPLPDQQGRRALKQLWTHFA